jgi:hypothetical protein
MKNLVYEAPISDLIPPNDKSVNNPIAEGQRGVLRELGIAGLDPKGVDRGKMSKCYW